MGINYEMKLTNTGKKINRKETLIFFGNKESFKLLKMEILQNFLLMSRLK